MINHRFKIMRKYIYVLVIAALAFSCGKGGLDFESGNVLGEIEVSASAGQITVSVETVGRWVVYEADNASWISFDVQGGVGNGAFTASYQANLSSVVDAKSSRKARIVVTSEDYAKSDTLNIIQMGFYSTVTPSEVRPSKEIVLEYVTPETKAVSIVYCSADGVTDMDALNQWAEQFDVVACGNGFIKPEVQPGELYTVCAVDGVNFVSTDLGQSFADGKEYEDFCKVIEQTYNAQNSPSKWVIGGQFYHYSMMQSSYASAPLWYPYDIDEPVFDSDRYAWNNNLYDCLWMSVRDYVTTWTSEGKSYMADYVYVSRDVLATISGVQKLDRVHGMTHNPIKVTLKY